MKTYNYRDKLIRYQGNNYKNISKYFSVYLKKYLPKNKNSKILEIGCGIGNLIMALKNIGYTNIRGTDIDTSNINYCKDRGLDVFNSNIITDNLNEKFDFIYAFDVIEHIDKDNIKTFLQNATSLLNENGVLIIKTQSMQNPLSTYSRYMDITHTIGFTKDLFTQLMDEIEIENYKIFFTDAFTLFDKNIIKFLIKFLIKSILRFFDVFLILYMFCFSGGTIINPKREILLIIKNEKK